MATTLATADKALKEFYLPAVREQLNTDIPMLNIVEPKGIDVEGRRAILSLHTGWNQGVGARGELGTLPTAGQETYAEERVPLRYNYGRGEISGPAIKQMKSDKGSFVRATEGSMKGVTASLKRDINRQLWGTSDGVIAGCGVTTASTLVALAATTTVVQMRQFVVGMTVDIGTVAQLAAGSGGRVYGSAITAVDQTAKTITISSAVTTAATDFVSRAGSGGAGASQKELTGLQTIVAATGTLFNVDPTVDPVWAAYVDATGGAISESGMAKVVQNIQINGGEWPTDGIGSDGVQRAFSNLLLSMKRFPGSRELKGGYAAVDFAAAGPVIPIMYDRDAPAQKLYWLNRAHIFFGKASDWEFMQEDGNVLSRVSAKDSYEYTLFLYADQFIDKRNAFGLQSGLTEA